MVSDRHHIIEHAVQNGRKEFEDMKKHTSISKTITALSLSAVSCASLMLAPMTANTALLQNYCITASASSDKFTEDTLILANGQMAGSSGYGSEAWYSKNKRFKLVFTMDGDLVLYDQSNSNRVVWHSDTGIGNSYSTRSFRMTMQTDGNFVIAYQNRYSRTATPMWQAHTVADGGTACQLRLSNDGELYVYHSQRKQCLWSSRSAIECTAKANTYLRSSQCISSPNRLFRAIMQPDGNFVVYDNRTGKDKAIFYTGTHGHSGAFFALQQDGNLVVYSGSTPLYNTGTCSKPYADYKLSLGDDGILTLVRKSDNRKIWTSNGSGKVESMLTWAIKIANDNSHGYNWNYLNRLGPDYDCSSLVCAAAKQAGFNVRADLTTYTMRTNFVAAGFTWIPWSQIGSTANLKRGDILLNEAAHTEIYLGNNQNVGAHWDYDGKRGDSSGKEISVGNYWFDNWNGVLRYNG